MTDDEQIKQEAINQYPVYPIRKPPIGWGEFVMKLREAFRSGADNFRDTIHFHVKKENERRFIREEVIALYEEYRDYQHRVNSGAITPVGKPPICCTSEYTVRFHGNGPPFNFAGWLELRLKPNAAGEVAPIIPKQ